MHEPRSDRERQLRSHLARIDDAVRRVSGGLYWSVSRPSAARQVGQYLTDLIASLTVADGVTSPAELELVSAYFNDGSGARSNETWVNDAAESARTNWHQPPAFIQAAATYDAAERTSLVAELRDDILGVCELLAGADRELSPAESDLIETVRNALSVGRG